jgi:hypothetical protein
MEYPSLDEVEKADRLQICTWWRYLPSPGAKAVGGPHDVFESTMLSEASVMNRIGQRLVELGGFTPSISKAIGWD